MPASGLREVHLQALRSALTAGGAGGSAPSSGRSSRSGSPDPSQVSRQEWLRHQEKLIKDVDPSFDTSLICPISLADPSFTPPPSSSAFLPSDHLRACPSRLGADPAEGPISSSYNWNQHWPGPLHDPRTHPGSASSLSGSSAGPRAQRHAQGPQSLQGFGDLGDGPRMPWQPATRRRSLDSSSQPSRDNAPCVNFREMEKTSHEMDLEGTFIESISIIPVDGDSECMSSEHVLFEIVPKDARRI